MRFRDPLCKLYNMEPQKEWALRLLKARNDETNRLASKLPVANKKERKIIREAIKRGINHDGAW